MEIIYKIVEILEWSAADRLGYFAGAAIDLADGYIHFSTAAQVRETARRHFQEKDDLLIVAVDAGLLGEALRWEVSRGGALFPHLYTPLALSDVLWTRPLPLGPDGLHRFPEEVGC